MFLEDFLSVKFCPGLPQGEGTLTRTFILQVVCIFCRAWLLSINGELVVEVGYIRNVFLVPYHQSNVGLGG